MCIKSVWNLLPLHFWVAVRLVYRCRSIEVKTRPEFSLDTWLLRLKWQLASIYDQNARPFSFSKRREYFHCLSVPWDSSAGLRTAHKWKKVLHHMFSRAKVLLQLVLNGTTWLPPSKDYSGLCTCPAAMLAIILFAIKNIEEWSLFQCLTEVTFLRTENVHITYLHL